MCNIENTKTMTLAKIEYLYAKMSDQTLINYIKAGICIGSPLAPNGVVKKGQNVFYTDGTVFEAVTAKAMMEQLHRRLEMPEIAIARRCAYSILSNESIDYLGNDLYLQVSKEILKDKFSVMESIKPEFTAVKISKKKNARICDLRNYTAEWIMRYMWCAAAQINEAELNYFILSKEPIISLKALNSFSNLQLTFANSENIYIKNIDDRFEFTNVTDPFSYWAKYEVNKAILSVSDRDIKIVL